VVQEEDGITQQTTALVVVVLVRYVTHQDILILLELDTPSQYPQERQVQEAQEQRGVMPSLTRLPQKAVVEVEQQFQTNRHQEGKLVVLEVVVLHIVQQEHKEVRHSTRAMETMEVLEMVVEHITIVAQEVEERGLRERVEVLEVEEVEMGRAIVLLAHPKLMAVEEVVEHIQVVQQVQGELVVVETAQQLVMVVLAPQTQVAVAVVQQERQITMEETEGRALSLYASQRRIYLQDSHFPGHRQTAPMGLIHG
jgi:hypothetical protein